MGKFLVWGTLAAGTALLTQAALAQQSAAEKSLEERFRQLDKNGDGQITTAELPQSPFFEQRDKNRDGTITLAEAMAHLAESDTTEDDPPAAQSPPASKARSQTPEASLRQGPQPLRPGDRGVGRRVPDTAFRDLAGTKHRLSLFAKQRAIVVAIT